MPRTNDAPIQRQIRQADDASVAQFIRAVMREFGCLGPGFSSEDSEVDSMSASYDDKKRSAFWVLSHRSGIVGCGGIGPLPDCDGICELRKMYFYPEQRGRGYGWRLLEACLTTAGQLGYRRCYVETVARMHAANRLYQRAGFRKLATPLGHTGHFGCDVQLILNLTPPD